MCFFDFCCKPPLSKSIDVDDLLNDIHYQLILVRKNTDIRINEIINKSKDCNIGRNIDPNIDRKNISKSLDGI